jgi:hypothetical protein
MNVRSTIVTPASEAKAAEARVALHDWQDLSEELNGYGCAVIEKLLSPEECRQIAGLYPYEDHFRSCVIMARHGFWKGGVSLLQVSAAAPDQRTPYRALSAPGVRRQRVERPYGH